MVGAYFRNITCCAIDFVRRLGLSKIDVVWESSQGWICQNLPRLVEITSHRPSMLFTDGYSTHASNQYIAQQVELVVNGLGRMIQTIKSRRMCCHRREPMKVHMCDCQLSRSRRTTVWPRDSTYKATPPPRCRARSLRNTVKSPTPTT